MDRDEERISVHFDSGLVHSRHEEWLRSVATRVGLGPLNPQPFWRFQELFLKASTKMLNSFYIEAETRHSSGQEYFRIQNVRILQGFELDKFLTAIEEGAALVDFDARTHHNHGTKFRLSPNPPKEGVGLAS